MFTTEIKRNNVTINVVDNKVVSVIYKGIEYLSNPLIKDSIDGIEKDATDYEEMNLMICERESARITNLFVKRAEYKAMMIDLILMKNEINTIRASR